MSLDHRVATFLTEHHSPTLTHVARLVTALGNEVTLCLATAVLLAVALRLGRRRDAGMVFVAMAGSAVLTVGVKHLIQRARPGAQYRLGGVDHSYSFPSGHTMNTTVFVIAAVAVAWPALRSARARAAACVAAAAVAVSVGLSRLYLGYHWATDVLAALVIGATWAGLLVSWYHRTPTPNVVTRLASTGGLPQTSPPVEPQ